MKTKEEWYDKICDTIDIECDYQAQQLLLKIIEEIQNDARTKTS